MEMSEDTRTAHEAHCLARKAYSDAGPSSYTPGFQDIAHQWTPSPNQGIHLPKSGSYTGSSAPYDLRRRGGALLGMGFDTAGSRTYVDWLGSSGRRTLKQHGSFFKIHLA